MTDVISTPITPTGRRSSLTAPDARLRRRHAAERRFRLYGLAAIAVSLLTLVVMLASILWDGIPAFQQATLTFPVELDAERLDENGNRERADLAKVTTVGYGNLLEDALVTHVTTLGLAPEGMHEGDIGDLMSKEAPGQVRDRVLANPDLVGQTIEVTVLAQGRVDGYLKGRVTLQSAERDSNVTPEQLQLAQGLHEAGVLGSSFNWGLLTSPDASDQRPEAAGLGVALIGSAYMMLLTALLSLPIGVAASIYLEEFAPKNRITDIIEVNIANLAAVPSIVFGILGLAIFINFAELPISSPLVGALVLTLMTLPTIIIATRAALRAVPPSIRDAALGVGASRMQTVFHHVLPLAMPGILTGTILGLGNALGQTAPLLLIGMVAFVDNYPSLPIDGFSDPATALPVQIYTWVSRSDPAFVERSSGAIIVLLLFLLLMNAVAILLRRRFERRW